MPYTSSIPAKSAGQLETEMPTSYPSKAAQKDALDRLNRQFPALIYVDGKFTTEAEFAKRFHVEEAK